jgi:hypothetical protein
MTEEDKIRIIELCFCKGDLSYKEEFHNYCMNINPNFDFKSNLDKLSWFSWRYLINVDLYTEKHKYILRKDKITKINNLCNVKRRN